MMSAFVAAWQLEWLRAIRRGRLFRLNIIIPLVLVIPIALGGAPAGHAAAVYTVLFALFGSFGAAIPALRDAERGMLRRLALTPLSAHGLLIGRGVAGGCIDALQLLPAIVVIMVAAHTPLQTAGWLLPLLVLSLIFANLFGLVVAAVSRSVAEGALFAAVATLLLLHASGVFRAPAGGSWAERIERLSPYRALHEVMVAACSGTTAQAPGVWAAIVAAALLGMMLSGRTLRAMARADAES